MVLPVCSWCGLLVTAANFCLPFIPNQDRAKELFKQVHEEKSLKGRAKDAIASACLYIACRQDGVPRSFKGTVQSMNTQYRPPWSSNS